MAQTVRAAALAMVDLWDKQGCSDCDALYARIIDLEDALGEESDRVRTRVAAHRLAKLTPKEREARLIAADERARRIAEAMAKLDEEGR